MNRRVITYDNFLEEGKREQQKIDELLDKGFNKLSDEEKNLLKRLSRGETLPEEDIKKPVLSTHKTGGGYLFDENGNIMTEEGGEKPGEEFVTTKGKQSGIDKISAINLIDARIYRNRDNEERFVYASTTIEGESGMTSDWIIYRTGGGPQYPFGQFLDTNAPKFRYYKSTPPEILWTELDYKFDYGMVMDDDLYEDFTNFVELYKENMARNKDFLMRIYQRFCKLL